MGITNLDSLTLGGDLIVAGTETITGGVTYAGNVTLGDTSGDVITINGTTTANAPFTVGADDTGHDVKFFGATASKFMVWDQSADDLILADGVALQLGGDESTADGFKIEFDGTSSLDIDALTADDAVTIGSVTSTDLIITTANGTITSDASADTLAIVGINASTTGTFTITSADAAALAIGLNGATNPAFVVDAATASSATGVKVKSAAAAAGVAVSTVSSGADEDLTIDAKGTGTISLNATATGNIVLGAAATGVSTSLTGGDTLKNATAVPATAGAVAAGVPVTMYTEAITIEVTSDVPTHTRPKGSICINIGGTTTNNRMYVNTDGGTTWTAFTTAA